MIPYVAYALLGYLMGSVMFSYLLPKLLTGKDVRVLSGDGNPGSANAIQKAGLPVGLLCLFCDVAKGILPVSLALGQLDPSRPLFGLVLAAPVLGEETAVGFMNKCSTTAGITTPLFSALSMGFGNDREGGGEGYVSGNVFATHLTGPVLVKNPAFTDLLVKRLFAAKGWELPAERPVYPHEAAAWAVTAGELRSRLG